MGVTSWAQARQTARDAAPPCKSVEVPLRRASGRRLAEPLRALTPLPAFDVAAMDGWAVRGSGPWRCVGRVLAGGPAAAGLQDGDALEVATGAQVAAGCDGVLPYERGALRDGLLTGPAPAGRHVRRAGEECASGTVLLPEGALLTPAAVGLAAAAGHDTLQVQEHLRLAAIITGDELLTRGLPGGGRVRDAVGPLLEGCLELVGLVHLPDDRAALRRAVERADADVVLTTGASSAGPADHLPAVLQDVGAELLVDGVAVRPGHPQVLARLPDGRLLVGLPGNPLAALAALVTLVAPLLGPLQERPVRLVAPLPRDVRSCRLVPVRRRDGVVEPTGHGGSAMLRGAATAEGFAALLPGAGVTQDALLVPFL